MYEGVLGLHSYWAYAVLVLLVIAILNAFAGLSSKRVFAPKDRQISMIAMVFTHVQFVIGFVLIFVSPAMEAAKAAGMGAVMKDSNLRLLLVEHPLVNLIAITLITIGWSKHKRAEDSAKKFKSIGILYAIGLVLLLSRIPYGQWFN
ncbi:hypothetical protein [uncultured Flavobacterium sp.]|uniref:hypothetical protein n=1 Tax=uncultured Flavobacterium sp. TaxID=165435 RepID=UPI0025FB2458|nr:hypothetical protein [uncultured Flavobacterium sp.]